VQDGQQILVPDSVQNSINLGSTDARILLITGPNGSGKTTLMRTLASCAILGQSLGIAPARSMRLAPFAYVGTSKDIQDAIMQNASRFAAELRTIEGLKARVKDIGSSKFAFLFIDEPYSGTTEGVGAHFTKQLIDELCYIFPNVISCIASHHHLEFDKLPGTTLGHMEVVHHGGINFTLTFRYLPNIADWWYAGGATLQGQFAEFFLRRQFAAIKNKVVETVVAATNDAAALATADKDEAIKA
jgi:DNA mismatch repair ATPase MutS